MKYKVIDKKYPSRIVEFHNKEVIFDHYLADVDEEVAYLMSRQFNEDYEILKKEDTVKFESSSWSEEKRLIWTCNYASANGFGNVAESTVKTLIEKGYRPLNPGAISGNTVAGGKLVDPIVEQSLNQRIIPNCLEIQHCQPPAFREGIVQRSWMYTMFETSHTPKRWIDIMNKAERILTPTSWVIPYWREQGLKTPVDVYGHGIDPEIYHYLDRPVDRETYTFLHYCQLSIRKGTDIVAKAFHEEFKGQNDVRLIVKNTYPVFPIPANLPNVTYISATYTKEEMQDLLFEADCFVFPTRGEGFGLTPFEAMATGLPTIVTNWSGPTDFCTKENSLLLEYNMVHSADFDFMYSDHFETGEDSGKWAEPKVEDVKAKMRWCYNHRKEAKALGQQAALDIRNKWTWSQKVDELIDIINKNI